MNVTILNDDMDTMFFINTEFFPPKIEWKQNVGSLSFYVMFIWHS